MFSLMYKWRSFRYWISSGSVISATKFDHERFCISISDNDFAFQYQTMKKPHRRYGLLSISYSVLTFLWTKETLLYDNCKVSSIRLFSLIQDFFWSGFISISCSPTIHSWLSVYWKFKHTIPMILYKGIESNTFVQNIFPAEFIQVII